MQQQQQPIPSTSSAAAAASSATAAVSSTSGPMQPMPFPFSVTPAAAPITPRKPPEKTLLKRIMLRLQDNRMESDDDDEKGGTPRRGGQRQQVEEDSAAFAMLKTVLNAVFVTTGLALLLSVIIVIIYTSIVKSDDDVKSSDARTALPSVSSIHQLPPSESRDHDGEHTVIRQRTDTDEMDPRYHVVESEHQQQPESALLPVDAQNSHSGSNTSDSRFHPPSSDTSADRNSNGRVAAGVGEVRDRKPDRRPATTATKAGSRPTATTAVGVAKRCRVVPFVVHKESKVQMTPICSEEQARPEGDATGV